MFNWFRRARDRYVSQSRPKFEAITFGLALLVGLLVNGIPGLIFAQVFIRNRAQWWAIIPAGVLLTLAGISLIESLVPWVHSGWLFFFGLAVTFGLVWRETGHVQQWARVVAVVCLFLAAVTLFVLGVRSESVSMALSGAALLLLAVIGPFRTHVHPAEPGTRAHPLRRIPRVGEGIGLLLGQPVLLEEEGVATRA